MKRSPASKGREMIRVFLDNSDEVFYSNHRNGVNYVGSTVSEDLNSILSKGAKISFNAPHRYIQVIGSPEDIKRTKEYVTDNRVWILETADMARYQRWSLDNNEPANDDGLI